MNKEDESRKLVLQNKSYNNEKLNFLDIGGKDGELTYLLADKSNFKYVEVFHKENKAIFNKMYNYFEVMLLVLLPRLIFIQRDKP